MKHISFENKIIIYWLYDEYISNANYNIYLNDQLYKNTNKTHCTFNNLKENTTYHIIVKNNNEVIFDENISTTKSKIYVNVLKKDPTLKINSKELQTSKLQKLLDDVKPNEVLYFPKGIYYTGALFIHSDTDIYLDKGAVIQGSSNPEDYLPYIPSRFEGEENMSYASLLNIGKMDRNNMYSTKNITLRGEGSILGGGKTLCYGIIDRELKLTKEPIITTLTPERIVGRKRGRLLNISCCDNVIIEGLTIGEAASWNIHMIYSRNIVTTGCHIQSHDYHNGDGWDPDSSYNCTLFNCIMEVGDDAVAIKSGKNPEGNIINIPSHDINVFDVKSLLSHGCAIGSEISGGIYNVYFYDCDFAHSWYGLHVKTTRKRGAYVKNVVVENCIASAICIENVPYNDDGIPANEITEFCNFKFKDITLIGISYDSLDRSRTDIGHMRIIGYEDHPELFHDITLENITYLNEKLLFIENVKNVNII